MRRRSETLITAVTFIVGCATGGVASHYVATAMAAPPVGTQRWVYTCFKDDDAQSIQQHATELGANGWELAASALAGGAVSSSPIWCFKRPRG